MKLIIGLILLAILMAWAAYQFVTAPTFPEDADEAEEKLRLKNVQLK